MSLFTDINKKIKEITSMREPPQEYSFGNHSEDELSDEDREELLKHWTSYSSTYWERFVGRTKFSIEIA